MSASDQTEKLANYIMANVEGEPSQSEGAGDCAIRIIGELQSALRDAEAQIRGMSDHAEALPASWCEEIVLEDKAEADREQLSNRLRGRYKHWYLEAARLRADNERLRAFLDGESYQPENYVVDLRSELSQAREALAKADRRLSAEQKAVAHLLDGISALRGGKDGSDECGNEDVARGMGGGGGDSCCDSGDAHIAPLPELHPQYKTPLPESYTGAWSDDNKYAELGEPTGGGDNNEVLERSGSVADKELILAQAQDMRTLERRLAEVVRLLAEWEEEVAPEDEFGFKARNLLWMPWARNIPRKEDTGDGA